MKLDEAIQILEDLPRYVILGEEGYEYKAVRLGIEALKRIKRLRPYGTSYIDDLLPGETEE